MHNVTNLLGLTQAVIYNVSQFSAQSSRRYPWRRLHTRYLGAVSKCVNQKRTIFNHNIYGVSPSKALWMRRPLSKLPEDLFYGCGYLSQSEPVLRLCPGRFRPRRSHCHQDCVQPGLSQWSTWTAHQLPVFSAPCNNPF